jgi:hypothetical protein
MKLEFGMIVTQGSGKLGGHVFTKGRNGNNARTKVKPINRRTTAQVDVRSILSTISEGWRALTDAQRLAWNSEAQQFTHHNNFGQKFHPTGKNYYTEVNINLLNAGSAIVNSPPGTAPAAPLTTLIALSGAPNTITATFTPTPVPAGNAMIVFGSRGLSAGVSFVGKAYRQFVTFPAATASPLNLTASYTAKFGTPITGTRVFLQVKQINIVTGLPSIPLQASVIIS